MTLKVLILAVLLFVLFLSGCGGTRITHLSAPEFLEIAKQIEQMSSATWTTYIGSSQTRAYLEYGDILASGGQSRTIIYWTELEKLPNDIAKALKAGESPWVPWQIQGAKPKDNQPVMREELLTAAIDGSKPVAKVDIQEVTMNVGIDAPLHLHPCPTMGVVTEGKIAFEIEGEQTRHLKAGDAFYEPADARVAKFDNEGNVPAKFVVFYLLGQGEKESVRILEK